MLHRLLNNNIHPCRIYCLRMYSSLFAHGAQIGRPHNLFSNVHRLDCHVTEHVHPWYTTYSAILSVFAMLHILFAHVIRIVHPFTQPVYLYYTVCSRIWYILFAHVKQLVHTYNTFCSPILQPSAHFTDLVHPCYTGRSPMLYSLFTNMVHLVRPC